MGGEAKKVVEKKFDENVSSYLLLKGIMQRISDLEPNLFKNVVLDDPGNPTALKTYFRLACPDCFGTTHGGLREDSVDPTCVVCAKKSRSDVIIETPSESKKDLFKNGPKLQILDLEKGMAKP